MQKHPQKVWVKVQEIVTLSIFPKILTPCKIGGVRLIN